MNSDQHFWISFRVEFCNCMQRWKNCSNVETTSWFRRLVLQWVSYLSTNILFQSYTGLQNQTSVKAWKKDIFPVLCLLSEAGWRVAFLICEKVLVGSRKGYLVYSKSNNKSFFNFPRTGNWENIAFWQSQHMKLPPGNNLTAGSSCSVKSAFLLLSRLLITHLAFPSSCQAPQPCAPTAALAPCSQPCSSSQPFLHKWPQIPHFHSFQAPAYGDRTWKLGSPGACGFLRASAIGSHQYTWLNIYLT